jgi:CHASE2 domain-containing sensor protein
MVTVEFGWYWAWSVVTVIVSEVPDETFIVVLVLVIVLAGGSICKLTWPVNSSPLTIATAVTG